MVKIKKELFSKENTGLMGTNNYIELNLKLFQ